MCNNNEVNPVLVKNICCKYKVSKKSKECNFTGIVHAKDVQNSK